MITRCGTLLGTLLATAILYAAVGNLAIGGGIGVYYGVPLALYTYDPWFGCMLPYRCRDPVLLRLELERDRRLQDLREQATPPESRISPGDGPWGFPRYIPPATPEASIQPAYRGASKLRPEYEQSAQHTAKPPTGPLE